MAGRSSSLYSGVLVVWLSVTLATHLSSSHRPQLAYCVVQFLEKESSLTEPVILLGVQAPPSSSRAPCRGHRSAGLWTPTNHSEPAKATPECPHNGEWGEGRPPTRHLDPHPLVTGDCGTPQVLAQDAQPQRSDVPE